jgi:hypothetical protein
MASAKNARKALARGATDEALVLLWNEIEPARLAGDVATLSEIGGIAERIRRSGDPGQQREAERMLATLRDAVEGDAKGVPADAAFEPRVEAGGTTFEDAEEAEEAAEEADGRRAGIGNLVWVLLFLLIVILNALRGVGGD